MDASMCHLPSNIAASDIRGMTKPTPPFDSVSTRRKLLERVVVASAIALTLLGNPAKAIASDLEIAGVSIPASQKIAGSELVLNGAGIRFKGPLRVYVAALYATRQSATAEKFHAEPGAKRMVLTMLREVDSSQFGRMFIDGIQKNQRGADKGKIFQALPRMGEIFATTKKLQPGDRLTLDWIPGAGMQFAINNVQLGDPFGSQDFYSALMNIWIGSSPADWRLKDALLGRPEDVPPDQK
jgi:hypothetical protein